MNKTFKSKKYYTSFFYRYFLGVPSGRGAPHHRHLYAVKFTSLSNSPTPDSSSRSGNYYQQHYQKTVHGSGRNRLVCLSCDVRLTDNTRGRRRRDFGVKQNRMDEARDDRLRQQQRERWENQKEEEEANNEKEEASAESGSPILIFSSVRDVLLKKELISFLVPY